MDQHDHQDRSTDSEQLQPQQLQQQKGRRLDSASTDHASGRKGDDEPRGLGAGQSPASGGEDGPLPQNQSPPDSTSAQRSGGQTQGGAGMGNASFEGSSLGGQSSADGLSGNEQPDDGGDDIDPTPGQTHKRRIAREKVSQPVGG